MMTKIVKNRLYNLSSREKNLMILTGAVAFTYLVYAAFFQSQFAETRHAQKTLSALNTTIQMAEEKRGELLETTIKLQQAQKELKEYERKEKKLKENLMARDHIGSVLKSLEMTARQMPIRLLELNSNTVMVEKKSDEYGGDADKVNIRYVKNEIKLKYRSQYSSGVDYLAKLLELPYAVSILSVKMFSSNGSERKAGREAGSKTARGVISVIEMEIYSR
ncbi:MAG: hypothetical protein IEMM0002_0009 [bacterium]|nr:MAG: hypothetical protein IEMM0002_0009 [bacterium]